MHLMSSKPQALTSIGPMRKFATNSKKISTELIEINDVLMGFNQYLTQYYKQLSGCNVIYAVAIVPPVQYPCNEIFSTDDSFLICST